MNKEIIAKSKVQIKNKWFKTKEDELDIALNIIDELEQQVKKQKEVIDKIFSRITLWKMEDITMETSKVLDDLLDILKEVSE